MSIGARDATRWFRVIFLTAAWIQRISVRDITLYSISLTLSHSHTSHCTFHTPHSHSRPHSHSHSLTHHPRFTFYKFFTLVRVRSSSFPVRRRFVTTCLAAATPLLLAPSFFICLHATHYSKSQVGRVAGPRSSMQELGQLQGVRVWCFTVGENARQQRCRHFPFGNWCGAITSLWHLVCVACGVPACE